MKKLLFSMCIISVVMTCKGMEQKVQSKPVAELFSGKAAKKLQGMLFDASTTISIGDDEKQLLYLGWNPVDKSKVTYLTGREKGSYLNIFDMESNQKNQIDVPFNAHRFLWHSDGKSIAFFLKDEVYFYNLKKKDDKEGDWDLKKLDLIKQVNPETAGWSPSGNYFSIARNGKDLFLRNINNKPQFNQVTLNGQIKQLIWNPKHDHLVYVLGNGDMGFVDLQSSIAKKTNGNALRTFLVLNSEVEPAVPACFSSDGAHFFYASKNYLRKCVYDQEADCYRKSPQGFAFDQPICHISASYIGSIVRVLSADKNCSEAFFDNSSLESFSHEGYEYEDEDKEIGFFGWSPTDNAYI